MQRHGEIALGERVAQSHLMDRLSAEALRDRLEAGLHLGGHARAARTPARRTNAGAPPSGFPSGSAPRGSVAQRSVYAVSPRSANRLRSGSAARSSSTQSTENAAATASRVRSSGVPAEPARHEHAVGVLAMHAQKPGDRLDVVGQRGDQTHATAERLEAPREPARVAVLDVAAGELVADGDDHGAAGWRGHGSERVASRCDIRRAVVFCEDALSPGSEGLWLAAVDHLARRFRAIRPLSTDELSSDRAAAGRELGRVGGEELANWRLELAASTATTPACSSAAIRRSASCSASCGAPGRRSPPTG